MSRNRTNAPLATGMRRGFTAMLLVGLAAPATGMLGGCANGAPAAGTTVTGASAKAEQTHTTTPGSVTTVREIVVETSVTPDGPGAAPPAAPAAEPEPRAAISPWLVPLAVRALAMTGPALLAGEPVPVEIDGVKALVPGGSKVSVKTTTTTTDPGVTETAKAEGVGASLRSGGDEGAAEFDASAPKAELGALPGRKGKGAGASGGSAAASAAWQTLRDAGLNAFHFIGGILLALAVGVFVFARPAGTSVAVALAAVGATALGVGVMIDAYPWVLALLALAVLGAGAWYVMHERRDNRALAEKNDLEETVNATVIGIENADTGAVKKAVRVASGGVADRVDAVVQRVLRSNAYGWGAASDKPKPPPAE